MNHPSHDTPPSSGISLDELALQTDTILAVADVAESLRAHPASALTRRYSITDPRSMVMLSTDSHEQPLAPILERLRSVTFESTTCLTPAGRTTASRIHLETVDPLTDKPMTAYINPDTQPTVSFADDAYKPYEISSDALSAIIARLTHPESDPVLSDFSAINTPDIADEICETLAQREFTDQYTERTYEFGDAIRIVTTLNDDKIVSCEIDAFTDTDVAPWTLTVDLSPGASTLECTATDHRFDTPQTLRYFNDILATIKSLIEPDSTPVDPDIIDTTL